MTMAYDIECIAVAYEQLIDTIHRAETHSLPMWLAHKLPITCKECCSLLQLLTEEKKDNEQKSKAVREMPEAFQRMVRRACQDGIAPVAFMRDREKTDEQ